MNPRTAVCPHCGNRCRLFRDPMDESRLRYKGHLLVGRGWTACPGSGELWGESPPAKRRKK